MKKRKVRIRVKVLVPCVLAVGFAVGIGLAVGDADRKASDVPQIARVLEEAAIAIPDEITGLTPTLVPTTALQPGEAVLNDIQTVKYNILADDFDLSSSLAEKILDSTNEQVSMNMTMAAIPSADTIMQSNTLSNTGTDDAAGNKEEDEISEQGDGIQEDAAQEDSTLELLANEEAVPEYLRLYSLGVEDESVSFIQQQLMELGYMEYAEPTNYYGTVTMDAVKLFQRQNELVQDGIMGEQTLGMLMSGDSKKYLLKNGIEGDDVKRMQVRLYELGYLAAENLLTGHFGDDTEAAIKSLQEVNLISVDGMVGKETIELLYSEDVKANLLSFGDKSDVVLAAQVRLSELGYLTTTPDGVYGNDTAAAVKLFQSKNDLVVDGYLGPTTRQILNSTSASTNGMALGDEGETVKRIQKLLIKYGYMNSGSDTGYFGEVTEHAVKAFQSNNGLSADGNVGTKTMSKLNSAEVNSAGSGSDTGAGRQESSQDGSDSDTGNAEEKSAGGSVKTLVKTAKSKVGSRYVWGSKGPNSFDCSGFVYWCLNQIGVKQSYVTSYGWRTIGKYKKITDFSKIKAGDVVVVYGHVGIAAGNGKVIDASSTNGEVVYRDLSSWWKRNFVVAWRLFD